MKSTKTYNPCEPIITYPCLMVGNSSGVVVLFSSSGRGVIVHKGTHGYNIGHTELNWGMSFFKPYNGSIRLEN